MESNDKEDTFKRGIIKETIRIWDVKRIFVMILNLMPHS